MLWLIITIFAYLFSAIASLFDKYLLKGLIPGPKIYAFYVGFLGILSLLLIPFGFMIPPFGQIILSLASGALWIVSLLFFFKAVKLFELSRIVPGVGSLTPIFVLGLTFIFTKQGLGFYQLLAFLFLLAGSFLISWEGNKFNSKSLQLSFISAFLFSLAYFSSKIVYDSQPFLSGFIWMRIGGFIAAIFLLFSKEVREELFKNRASFKTNISGLFLLGQTMGAGGFILQSFAIKLAPLNSLAFINALEGIKYLFLLILTGFISVKFPQIMKEKISPKIIRQKIISLFFIGTGLLILFLK